MAAVDTEVIFSVGVRGYRWRLVNLARTIPAQGESPAALLLASHCAATAAAAPRRHVSRSAITAGDGHGQLAGLMDSVAPQLSITDEIGSPGQQS